MLEIDKILILFFFPFLDIRVEGSQRDHLSGGLIFRYVCGSRGRGRCFDVPSERYIHSCRIENDDETKTPILLGDTETGMVAIVFVVREFQRH